MVVVRMRYEGGFYQNFTFEKQSSADKVLALLAEQYPDVLLEPENKRK